MSDARFKNVGFRGDPEANKKYIYNALIKDGFTHAAATGIVGNILVETGEFKYVEELAPNVNNQRGLGILQWSGGRAKDFEAWLNKNGKNIRDIKANVEYMLIEMKKKSRHHWTGGGSYEMMKQAETVEDATATFMNTYLRPNKNSSHYDKRLAYAQRYDKVFQGEDPGDSHRIDEYQEETAKNIAQEIESRNATKRADNIVSTIDFTGSSISEEDREKIRASAERFMKVGRMMPEEKEDPYFQIAKKAYDSTPKDTLNRDIIDLGFEIPEEPIETQNTGEDMNPSNDLALGGSLQPNGRITDFTREEDIVAQNKTSYEPS